MLPRLPGELAEIFRNRSFRILFGSLLVFASAAGLSTVLNNHAYVFVWRIPSEMLPLGRTEPWGGHPVRQGIEFDAIGRRIAYHFLRRHRAT